MEDPIEKPAINGFGASPMIDEAPAVPDEEPQAPAGDLARVPSNAALSDISKLSRNLGDSGTIAPSATTNGQINVASKPNAATVNTHRVNVDTLMTKFQRRLGKNWDSYRDTITHFLMGKLSRPELVSVLGNFLGPKELHMHNYLLLSILANSFRELPPGEDSVLSGWKQSKGGNKSMSTDTPTELLHREILALPMRERKRIKNISRDNTKKPPVTVPPPVVIATRQAILPKIPYVQNGSGSSLGSPATPKQGKDKDGRPVPGRADGSKPGMNGSAAGSGASGAARSGAGAEEISAIEPQNDTHESLTGATLDGQPVHPGRFSGPLMWAQDIIHGLDTTLASESYEVPDEENLGTRMLGIALENGMIRGIDVGSTDVMLRGLEAYINTIVTQMSETLRSREVNLKRPMTSADLNRFVDARSMDFHEMAAPLFRLKTHYLRDEETALPSPEAIEPEKDTQMGNSEKDAEEESATTVPNNYLELVSEPMRRKRTAEEALAWENAEQGKKLLVELLN